MSDAVKKLEEAGDAAGLEHLLRHPRFETLGDVQLKGEAARRTLNGLPYSEVRVMDMDSVRRVDVSVDERISACAALERLGTPAAAKALINGLGDPVPKVGLAVWQALKGLAPKLKGKELWIDAHVELDLKFDRPVSGMKLVEAQTQLEEFFGV